MKIESSLEHQDNLSNQEKSQKPQWAMWSKPKRSQAKSKRKRGRLLEEHNKKF